jgi:hypothetical protein
MTIHILALGAGKAALIHDAGTDNEHVTALDRAPSAHPSPEQPFERFTFGECAQAVIEGFIPDQWREEIAEWAGLPPQFAFDRLHTIPDMPNGDKLVRGILADLEMLPEKATLQEADDLIAASYLGETAPQVGMRRLRALGALLAAGEDAWAAVSYLTRFGPSSDFYAIDVAVRAGQVLDAADPRVTSMPKPGSF